MPAKKATKKQPAKQPGRPAAATPPKGWSATYDQLVQKFRTSTKTIAKLIKDFGIQRDKRGLFNDDEIAEALKSSREIQKTGIVKSDESKKSYQDYWAAKAEEKALDVAVKKGELIDKEVVVQELIDRETVFKNRLLGLSDFFASRLVGCGAQEIKAICTEQFMGLLKELARRGSEAHQKANPS